MYGRRRGGRCDLPGQGRREAGTEDAGTEEYDLPGQGRREAGTEDAGTEEYDLPGQGRREGFAIRRSLSRMKDSESGGMMP